MTALGLEVAAAFRSAPVGQRRRLVEIIEAFLARRADPAAEPPLIIRLTRAPGRSPSGRAGVLSPLRHEWPLPPIDSEVALAETLELSLGQLAWLADVRSLERRATVLRLQNYRYAAVPRRSGLPRVIEAPKARLKEIQRWILREILDHVPAHEASHGFVRGRSAVSHARLHTGQELVLRLDLSDFFASIAAGRVYGIFHTLGYRPAVAHTLTGLCTNVVPQAVWQRIRTPAPGLVGPHFWLGRQLATPHLPQGAPTSPALANLCAFGLDRRLSALAAAAGWRYSRYADDLTFSGRGRPQRPIARFQALVTAILREEGFRLNDAKSSVRTSATRQSVCGIVVNARPNVPRAEYDRLKAILHNAVRDGPGGDTGGVAAAALEAHLRGRIAWVASLHPERGAKLRRQFDQIAWEAPPD